MLKKEHPDKTWLNCGLDVLCVMLYFDGDDLARIVEKVLRQFTFHLPGYIYVECSDKILN